MFRLRLCPGQQLAPAHRIVATCLILNASIGAKHSRNQIVTPGSSRFTNYAQAIAVMKSKSRQSLLEGVPETPYTEILVADGDIVQQNDSSRTDFWKPGIEIVGHRLKCMQPINVEKRNCFVLETAQSFIASSKVVRRRFEKAG
jgi:hypothetical protein